MGKFFPLHVHSNFSLLDGLSSCQDIVNRCNEIDVAGSALTDHGTISGHIEFLSKMKKADKKPLLGIEMYVCEQDSLIKDATNKKLAHLCIIAKNTSGWKEMLRMVSKSNDPDRYYYKPRLSLDEIFEFAKSGNLMAFSGHLGSHMSNVLFEDGVFSEERYAEGKGLANRFRDAFGENFYLEVQLMDCEHNPEQIVVSDMIRRISKDTGIHAVATMDAHYAKKEQAVDHRIILCSNMNITINKGNDPNFMLNGFFRSSQFHIPSYEEMKQWHTDEELENTIKFADKVEEYDILRAPEPPPFSCPNNLSANDYLRQLCEEGWNKKIRDKVALEKHDIYKERLEKELKVIFDAGLSSYFLILADILDFVRQNGWITSPGRGSSAGSLVAYLTSITAINPIKYHLIFERFYNAGRNTPGRISMPDIDIDVPKYAREQVVEYVRKKYGRENVGQMVTFQTIKGRGAIKAVLSAYGGMTFQEMNDITNNIIEESKISDELQKMKEETGDSSIIRWCLENIPKKLEEWCHIDKDGNLKGPLANRFEQAMRLEGTKTAQSKHPAGIVVSANPLSYMCPMILDTKTKNLICGFEMEDLENVGGLKLDILGIAMLDKCMGVSEDLYCGEIHEIKEVVNAI